MGTKKYPSQFDCYANAKDDEPMFVLLGRDRNAPSLVEAWAEKRAAEGENLAMVAEARQVASAMRDYLKKLGKAEQPFATHYTVRKEGT